MARQSVCEGGAGPGRPAETIENLSDRFRGIDGAESSGSIPETWATIYGACLIGNSNEVITPLDPKQSRSLT